MIARYFARKRIWLDERGAALIEMAVVLPVFMTIGLGILEFGNYIYQYQLVSSGIRDAARYLGGLPYDSQNPGSSAQTTREQQARNIAAFGKLSGTCDPDPPWTVDNSRVKFWCPADVYVTYQPREDDGTLCGTGGSPSFCRGRDAQGRIYEVTVSTIEPYQALGFLGYLQLGSIAMQSEHTERVFGVR